MSPILVLHSSHAWLAPIDQKPLSFFAGDCGDFDLGPEQTLHAKEKIQEESPAKRAPRSNWRGKRVPINEENLAGGECAAAKRIVVITFRQ